MIKTEQEHKLQEIEDMMWSKSPHKKGDLMNIHPDFTAGVFKDEVVELLKISLAYDKAGDGMPYEYLCKFPDGRTAWLRAEWLIRPNSTYSKVDYDLCFKID